MRKNAIVNQYELPVEITKDGSYYIALCPVWSDCYAQGRSVENAIEAISGVARTLIDIYDEEGKRVPLKKQSPSRVGSRIGFNLSILVPTVS